MAEMRKQDVDAVAKDAGGTARQEIPKYIILYGVSGGYNSKMSF